MEPDYKALFKQAIFHLRCVSGSRNSFTPEAVEVLRGVPLRDPAVSAMQRDAAEFLQQHDK